MTPRAASRAMPPMDPTMAGTRGTTFVLLARGVAGVAVGPVPGAPVPVASGVKNGVSRDDDADENDEIDSIEDDDSPEDDENAEADDSADVDENDELANGSEAVVFTKGS